MTPLELALAQIQFTRDYTNRLLEQTPKNEWFKMPAGGVSHIAWQVGHVAMAQYRLALERVRGAQPDDGKLISEEFLRLFARDSVPDPDARKYPSAEAIKSVFDEVHKQVLAELPKLDPSEMDHLVLKPHPLAKTKLWAILWSAHHEILHTGQIGLLRRQLGHAAIW